MREEKKTAILFIYLFAKLVFWWGVILSTWRPRSEEWYGGAYTTQPCMLAKIALCGWNLFFWRKPAPFVQWETTQISQLIGGHGEGNSRLLLFIAKDSKAPVILLWGLRITPFQASFCFGWESGCNIYLLRITRRSGHSYNKWQKNILRFQLPTILKLKRRE